MSALTAVLRYDIDIFLNEFTTTILYACYYIVLQSAAGTMAFTETSKLIYLEGTFLHAECLDLKFHYNNSEIDLNKYITNIDGVLIWCVNGNFGATSKDLSVLSDKVTILKCLCKNAIGQWREAYLDLDQKIMNIDGVLSYDYRERKKGGMCVLL